MNNKHIVDAQFIIRVIKNEVTDEEREIFYQWLEESDENKEEFGKIALLWDKTVYMPTPLSPDLSNEWEKLKKRISQSEKSLSEKSYRIYTITQVEPEPSKSKQSKYFSQYFKKNIVFIRVAAVILISLIAYQFITGYQPNKTNENKIDEVKFFEFITKKGERATIPLADGSIVYLNAESRLTYPQYFDGEKRFLKLEGEAYFSVKSDPERPFVVQTGDKFTEVKGTEFNIRYRKNKLSVVVTKGKVVLYNQDSSNFIDLRKGELITSTTNGFTQPIKVDTRLYTAWRENKLSFVATPLSDVLEELERFYNVETICKNRKILNRTLTGYFYSDSLDEILTKISLALDFKFHRKGKKIIIF